ncbi:ARM repeat-containing protein [Irpex rosettiformis]|uniref:ARM repeat-containing protein n=1 Tax=Irpex rosettiformis TaxID=378272 RepID=A0ACB8TX08_9APHY|nr:ARM repeat-containing protein [Irpex rosettiformis]
MDEDQSERTLLAAFTKYDEFSSIQRNFLDACGGDKQEDIDNAKRLLIKLTSILAEYQEQSYLLDPFLESLVDPVVVQLKKSITNLNASESSQRIGLVAHLLYLYINFRGYKSITRFFPHEIADLSVALDFLLLPDGPAQVTWQWHLRYVMLLWMSLICMLPFDLAQFDDPKSIGKTASDVETVAKSYLSRAGVERQGAAILLARLYSRKDTNVKFPLFLDWTKDTVIQLDDLFQTIGALQVLCELTKSAPAHQVLPFVRELFNITSAVGASTRLASNTLIRKLRIKLVSRTLLRLMPAKRKRIRSKGKTLRTDSNAVIDDESDEDIDVPNEVENILEDLLKALQDRDTVVRYSAAKAVARISERLPSDFSEQVLDNVIQLFSIHSMAAASMYDMPAIAEYTWHGTSLACAEMARRGLVPDDRLGELIGWMRKALYFDIRKGAHSVGSSVRDAASYVLWSLARAQSPEALYPHATGLAQTLVTVSCFDREVHIRRAASAAFQEFVGRTNLFPHGIDILRKTDFYAVGTRRNAFSIVAVEVAEHDVYRQSLLDHLLTVTVRHWDPAMRKLGAQAIRNICQLDLWKLGQECIERVTPYLTFVDSADIHGALLTLTELAIAYKGAEPQDRVEFKLRELFSLLSKVSPSTIQSIRNELITSAACHLIASSITLPEIEQPTRSSVPHWRSIIDFALKSAVVLVQESAADAMAAVSVLMDCNAQVERFIQEAKSGTAALQQSVCRMLGGLDYNSHPEALKIALAFLLACVDRSAPTGLKNVEARRNAYYSLPRIIQNVLPRLREVFPPEIAIAVFSSFLSGLEDYSTDERGDVGSWIRIACVKGIADYSTAIISNASTISQGEEYLPLVKFHEGIAGILKQGVERLDNVRQQAGEQLLRLLPLSSHATAWQIHGEGLMRELFSSDKEEISWSDSAWLFPRAVKLLTIKEYRHAVLSGLVLSVSSKTDSTQRPVCASLIAYAHGLSVRDEAVEYDLNRLATDLLAQAKRNLALNSIVIPVLQTFNVLLDADAFELLEEDTDGLKSLHSLLSICARNVTKIKNVQRIVASMKVVANLLTMSSLRAACASHLPAFLGHQYPKIRSDTAETLYLVLQSKDVGIETDEAEEILLETEWSSDNMDVIREAAERCAGLLKGP